MNKKKLNSIWYIPNAWKRFYMEKQALKIFWFYCWVFQILRSTKAKKEDFAYNHPTRHRYCSLLLSALYVPEFCSWSFASMISFNSYNDSTRDSHFTEEETASERLVSIQLKFQLDMVCLQGSCFFYCDILPWAK